MNKMLGKIINHGVEEFIERIIAFKVEQMGGKTIATWVIIKRKNMCS